MIIMHLGIAGYCIKGWICSMSTLSRDMGIFFQGKIGVTWIIANFSDIWHRGA